MLFLVTNKGWGSRRRGFLGLFEYSRAEWEWDSAMEKYLLCGEFMTLPGGGKVYKGRRRGTVEFVGIQKHDKTTKEEVANAVRLVHSLDHVNILRFFEWYETSKHVWVITELANGGSLADILDQDGTIPFPNVTSFLVDIIAGLNYLHCRQIVYCDLQPSKVVLDCCQCLKLCDFTLAQQQGEQRYTQSRILEATRAALQRQTDPPPAVPSPFYSAPEVFSGGQFSFFSDLWSLGCLMFELCTGKKPFQAVTSEDLIHGICHGAPVVSNIRVTGDSRDPSELIHVITQLLKKSPEQRLTWNQLLRSPFMQTSISVPLQPPPTTTS